ncbi:hypothetical protein X474_08245 [Dethiosulfatarculus sandiegensis]|uniref:Uncharacterized protein n=1 Tax=Dethiosulfatarculus sandiegensis TaxID=1429043 RepID=A0A0D2J906_9BACT|nr:hypothetical protein X474_08245 [Dethiosulfatarculus sandiegensis]
MKKAIFAVFKTREGPFLAKPFSGPEFPLRMKRNLAGNAIWQRALVGISAF